MTVPVTASEGSSSVDCPGTSPVGADSEDVIVGPRASVVAGTEVGVGAEVAVELPPQAANRNRPEISATPNTQIRFLFTKVPPRFLTDVPINQRLMRYPQKRKMHTMGRFTNIAGQYWHG